MESESKTAGRGVVQTLRKLQRRSHAKPVEYGPAYRGSPRRPATHPLSFRPKAKPKRRNPFSQSLPLPKGRGTAQAVVGYLCGNSSLPCVKEGVTANAVTEGLKNKGNGFSRLLPQAQNDKGKPNLSAAGRTIFNTATPVLGRSSRPPKNKANEAETVLFHIRPGGTPT